MMLLPTPASRRHGHRRRRRRRPVDVGDHSIISGSSSSILSTSSSIATTTATAMMLSAMIFLAAVTSSSSASTTTASSSCPSSPTAVVTTTSSLAGYCAGPFSSSLRFIHDRRRYPSRSIHPTIPSSQILHNAQQLKGGGRRRRQSSSSSPPQSQQPYFNPSMSSSSSTLMAASVPPPNSRLGRNLLLKQQMQQQQHQQQQRASTPLVNGSSTTAMSGNSGRRNRTTGINTLQPSRGYATYGSYYARYCSGSNGDEDIDVMHSNESDDGTAMENKIGEMLEHDDNNINIHHDFHRHRAPMLRFMDNGSRLRFPRSRSLQLQQQQRRLRRRKKKDPSSLPQSPSSSRLDYERRKAEWAAKYTSVSTLRKSFGSNKNRIWGDFDPVTTRKLYHTLLPRALLELRGLRDGLVKSSSPSSSSSSSGDGTKEDTQTTKKGRRQRRSWRSPILMNDDYDDNDDDDFDDIDNNTYLQQELKELAPLAYRARLAAKEYARERCILPARIGSMLYDGYRSWRRYGKWNRSGMTWEQIWNKYEDQVLREVEAGATKVDGLLEGGGADGANVSATSSSSVGSMREDEELTARICLRILERSVVTNEAIDRLFLKSIAVEDVSKVDSSSRADSTDGRLDGERNRQRRQQQQQRRRKLVRQFRRKLQIQADLQAIEKKFDDDIRELLRFSNLASKEGEERRSRRRGGAFFWKKSTENRRDEDSDVIPGTAIPINGDSSISEAERGASLIGPSGREYDDDAKSASGVAAADFALRGGTIDTGAIRSAAESNDVNSNIYSMTETTVTMNIADSEVGNEQNRRERTKNGDIMNMDDEKQSSSVRKLAVHEVIALRILAMTKQRIASLQASPQLGGDDGEDADSEV